MSKPKLDAARMQTELSQSAFFRPSNESSNQHVNMSTSKQNDKPTSQHTAIPTSQQVHKSTEQQVGKLTVAQMERFTTYLRPGTIKAVKLLALETDQDVYEVVQEAVDTHLRKQGRG